MKDLTPRQILDAVRESLDEAARKVARDKPDQFPEISSAKPPTATSAEPDPPDARRV